LSNIKFYVIDIETTGLMAKHHEITEISIIRVDDRVQLTRNVKCDFPFRASLDALRITNKTMESLSTGEEKSKVLKDCNDFFNQDGLTKAHRCIIGHNIISFDKKFLHAFWEEFDQEFAADLFLDTMSIMKHYNKIRNIKARVNLDTCCGSLGIKKFAGAHTAKADTRNTYLLYNKLINDCNIDYIPFIKNFPHSVKCSNTDVDDLLKSFEEESIEEEEEFD